LCGGHRSPSFFPLPELRAAPETLLEHFPTEGAGLRDWERCLGETRGVFNPRRGLQGVVQDMRWAESTRG